MASIKTIIKRGFRKVGLPVRFGPEKRISDTGIWRRLSAGGFFAMVADLNKELIWAEQKWDGVPGTDMEPESAAYIRKQVIDLYSFLDRDSLKNISMAIGPFTNKYALDKEIRAVDDRVQFTEEDMLINLSTSGGPNELPVNFTLPAKQTIAHSRVRQYQVAYFGAGTTAYWDKLEQDIDNICGQALNAIPANGEQRRHLENNISLIRDRITKLKGELQKKMTEFEKEQRSAIQGQTGVQGRWGTAESLRAKLIQSIRLDSTRVFYQHTYKVIKPLDEHGNLLNAEFQSTTQNIGGNFKRPEEVAPGLDENGWPLEVGDGKTEFNGSVLGEGEVLIDIYEGRTPRVIPHEFIEDCDLLEMAVWLYVAYDAYRDDLRDGRHHPDAIGIMEVIDGQLSLNPAKRMRIWNRLTHGIHTKKRMYLNKLPGSNLRPALDPAYKDWELGATQLNPAFDWRAKGKAIHLGRKYYYNIQDNVETSKEPNKPSEPTMTTRGAALYILHRVIEETKYWGANVSPDRAGVIEILEAIGDATLGYDIGPNIEYTRDPEKGAVLHSWGHELTRNPFKPRRSNMPVINRTKMS